MKRKAVSKIEHDDVLLSFEAFDWLKSIDYASKSQEEKEILIKAAKIAYPIRVEK